MKPKSVEGIALFLLLAAAIIGVIAAITGDWLAVAAMVLVSLGQGLILRKARLDGAPKQ